MPDKLQHSAGASGDVGAMAPPASTSRRYPVRLMTWIVLAAAFLLRCVLVFGGGQYFWPDEARYETSRQAAALVLQGHVHEALLRVFEGADHLLFKLVAVLPALVQEGFKTSIMVPTLAFAAVSVWTLWLIGRIARALGGDETEVFFAVVFAACSASLFYYSRHLFPYDLSLGFFLFSLIASQNAAQGLVRRSLMAGVWASLGFLSYNGYWVLGGVLLVVHTLLPWQGVRDAFRKASFAFAGLVAPILLTLLVGRVLGVDLITSYVKFAGTVNHGDFGIAWRFIPQYFLETEGLIFVGWSVALIVAVFLCARERRVSPLCVSVLITVLLYAALVIPSDVIPRFTVAARHVRILAPFMCLVAAHVVVRLWRGHNRPRWIAGYGTIALILVTALNFALPLRQMFPTDFSAMCYRELPRLVAADHGPYRVENDVFLHNPDWAPAKQAQGRVVLRRAHPFQYIPYLYEGYSEAARRRYLDRDLSMRIVRLDAGGPTSREFPGPVELTLRWEATPKGFQPEPLLSTGRPGAGDLLYAFYEDAEHVRFALDHWGGPHLVSKALPLSRGTAQKLVVSLGSLYPPGTDALFESAPELEPLKRRLVVLFNGERVLDEEVVAHANASSEIHYGLNLIGASTAIGRLDAEILGFRRFPRDLWQEILDADR